MMEERLQVTLPNAYKKAVADFPWQQFAGSTRFSLWDDAALNIERTLEYREGYGGSPPWPLDYVHIGDDDDACPYAMRCSDGTIVKTDHGNLIKPSLERFASVEAFVQKLRQTLNDDG